MKKLLKVMLAVLLVVGMGGCSKNKIDEDALKLYSESVRNIFTMTSAGMNLAADVEMSAQGETQNMNIVLDGGFTNEEKFEFASNVDMTVAGVKAEDMFQIYLKDDVLYMATNFMGEQQKTKQEFDLSMFDNLKLVEKQNSDVEQLKAMTEESSLTEENGIKKIHIKYDASKFGQSVKDAAETEETEEMNVNVSDAAIDAEVNADKYLTKLALTMRVEQSPAGATNSDEIIVMNIKIEISFDNIGNAKLTFPDFSDYTEAEITEDLLGEETE